MKEKIVLLGLNELNFDYINHYCQKGLLPNFKQLIEKQGYKETVSENKYELLEPWIQWVTIQTGKTYSEHQIFRLGDIVERDDLKQIFEIVEEKGFTVGAVSPFNADNRLQNPMFYIPDPWTKTKASGEQFIRNVSVAVSQAVNDNSKESVSKKSILSIVRTLVKVVKPSQYRHYVKLFAQIKSKKGVKAVVLDKLLGDIFVHQWNKHQPDFATLFLNTGAHFQHHYMFNSDAYAGNLENPDWYCPKNQDPLLMILKEYDGILGRLIGFNTRLIICTGLHQKPHKHTTFYWRLKNHESFLKKIGIQDIKMVTPRMSRDFLVEFSSANAANIAKNTLDTYKAEKDGIKIFTVDNRGTSLFVELTYPNNINKHFKIIGEKSINYFENHIAFVAIKNGEHDGVGYYVDTDKTFTDTLPKQIPLKQIFSIIEDSFES